MKKLLIVALVALYAAPVSAKPTGITTGTGGSVPGNIIPDSSSGKTTTQDACLTHDAFVQLYNLSADNASNYGSVQGRTKLFVCHDPIHNYNDWTNPTYNTGNNLTNCTNTTYTGNNGNKHNYNAYYVWCGDDTTFVPGPKGQVTA